MTAVPSMSSIRQWFRAAAPDAPAACSIVLHGTPTSLSGHLAAGIATYLNEYDDDGDGLWLAIPPELVPLIAEDPGPRHILGLDADPEHVPPTSPAGIRKALAAMAALGHTVLDSPLAAAATRPLRNVFHVGLGLPPDSLTTCHLILNPTLFHPSSLPLIVGDVFLEWANSPIRRTTPIHEI